MKDQRYAVLEDWELIGAIAKRHRGARGVREAAREIGISHATLSRVERGFAPDARTLQRVCAWLGFCLTGPRALVPGKD